MREQQSERERGQSRAWRNSPRLGASIVVACRAALFSSRSSFYWDLSLLFSLSCSLCAPHLPLHCVKLIKVVGWLGVAAAAFFRCCKRVFLLVRPPLRHPPGQVGHHPLARNSFAFMLLGFSCFLLFRMPLACYSLFVIVLVVAPLLLIAVHSEKSP